MAASLSPILNPDLVGNATSTSEKQLERAKLSQACRMFESYFINQLWKAMRKTVNQTGFISGGAGEKMFTDMLDQAMSDSAVRGSSIGIAEMLQQQLGQQSYSRPSGNISGNAGRMTTPVAGQVSSEYGMREHPVTGELTHHDGVDLAAEEGEPIRAAASGVVSFTGEKGGYGKTVVIDHSDGSQTLYGHCSELSVSQGQRVIQGQPIAAVGSTGVSTGPHLHFEVRDAGGVPVDPGTVLGGSVDVAA